MEIKTSTLNGHIECHGRLVGENLQQKAEQTLQQYSMNAQTGGIENPELIPDSVKYPGCTAEEAPAPCVEELFREQIAAFNNDREDCDQIKDNVLIEAVETTPENCVYVSIDDVGVSHQKDTRRNGGSKQGKVVENTVVHIQTPEGCYLLTAIGMKKAFSLVVAFLLSDHLLENRHIYLRELDCKFIKNPLRLEDAVNHLERKKPYIPCYALRSILDYRNSSNPVEKANDLIVAGRQKHNGMSWSYTGSGSLAVISAMLYNGEIKSWLNDHQIPFTLPIHSTLQEAA